MSADSMGFSFVGGDFLVVPAGVVHGFQFEPETQGMVTTIADKLLQDLLSRDPGLVTLFDSPAIYRNEELGQIDLDLDKLNNELAWTTSYSRLAVETRLLSVLIELARSKALTASGPLRRGRPQLKLVGRFRHLLEQELRTHLSVEAYADKLAVTTTQLRRACQRATGRSPSRLIQERLTIEAKRTLCYSNMTVGEVAGHLGFDDPAYFSRFFTKMTDMAPNRYRDQHQKVVDVGAHKN